MEYSYTFKVLMLGDASVGKTSLTIRYVSGNFVEDLRLTIGVDFYSKTINYKGHRIKLQIWDFGGEERFRFLLPQYCKGANGAFFLYDITNPASLSHLPDWSYIVREASGNIPIMLVGSKLDLKEYRTVPRDQGINAARRYNMASFVELSSKTGQNVERAFQVMSEILLDESKKKKEKMIL
jgi:Ras-related protein Rab-43